MIAPLRETMVRPPSPERALLARARRAVAQALLTKSRPAPPEPQTALGGLSCALWIAAMALATLLACLNGALRIDY